MATYYFSTTDGDDSRTSVQAQNSATPWQTISKLNSFFSSLVPGDQVLFKKGDTFYGGIIPNVSGAAGNPISFGAYSTGADPIITGFQDVSAWTSLGGNQYESTSAISTLSTLNMVTISDVFAPIGKWPNGTFVYNTINSHTGTDLQQGLAASITSAVSLPFDWTGGQVVIRKRHWIIDKATVTSQAGDTINYINPSIYGSVDGFGFFIQNHQDACDTEGEWWYNSSTKKIGIYSAGSPTGVKVVNVDILVNIGAQSYLNFTGLQFDGSNSATVNLSSGHHVIFSGCSFNYAGINAFTVQAAAHHITITGCSANVTNNNFITGGGSQNWTITSNTIQGTGQTPGMGESRDGNYIGMYNIGSNSLIQYNDLLMTGYNGIDFRGGNIQVLNNYVDTFCNVKDDGAGIYTFTGASTTIYAQRTVDHNIVLNAGGATVTNGTTTTNEDAHGIYMDDNSSQVTISNNTVANCGGAGIFLHADHNITLTNNTIYNNALKTANTYAQIYEVYPGVVTTAAVRNLTVTANKFVSRASTQIVAYYKTNEANMSQWPTGLTNANFNNNYYCRPINENATTFQIIRSSGTTNTDLPGWTALSGGNLDNASNISPVTIPDVSFLRFEVNPTNVATSVDLDGDSYIDVAGVGYTGTISLAPYSSLVLILFESGSGSLPPQEDILSITINFTPCDPMPPEGYDILYRAVGDIDYIDAGFFTASPAVISVDYPAGTHFEGVIKSDCGDVPWNI